MNAARPHTQHGGDPPSPPGYRSYLIVPVPCRVSVACLHLASRFRLLCPVILSAVFSLPPSVFRGGHLSLRFMTPEQSAREQIDRQLEAAGWNVQDYRQVNLGAEEGVAVREFLCGTSSGDSHHLALDAPTPHGFPSLLFGWPDITATPSLYWK